MYKFTARFPVSGWREYETVESKAVNTVAFTYRNIPLHHLVAVYHKFTLWSEDGIGLGEFIKIVAVTRDGDVYEFDTFDKFKQYLIDKCGAEF